jgi:hypothetical protein
VALTGWLAGWTAGAAAADSQRAGLRRLRPCLLHAAEAPDECLVRLYPSPQRLRALAARMARLQLGPFAHWRPEPSLSTYERAGTSEAGELESITLRERDDTALVRGWAIDPVTGEHARTVLVASGDDVLGRAWTGLPRRGGAAGDRAGFDLRIRRFRLAARSEPLRAWVVLDDGRVVPTRGALRAPQADGSTALESVAERGAQ